MSDWTEWVPIEQAAEQNGSFEEYGIYQVRIADASETPRPIQRLVGTDVYGLCYIGRSGLRATGGGRTVANRMREWLAIWHPGAALWEKAKSLLGNHRLEV